MGGYVWQGQLRVFAAVRHFEFSKMQRPRGRAWKMLMAGRSRGKRKFKANVVQQNVGISVLKSRITLLRKKKKEVKERKALSRMERKSIKVRHELQPWNIIHGWHTLFHDGISLLPVWKILKMSRLRCQRQRARKTVGTKRCRSG